MLTPTTVGLERKWSSVNNLLGDDSRLPRQEMLGEQSDVWLGDYISGEHQALLLPSVHLLLILQLLSRLQQPHADLD